jgi:4-hydroxybenzoate polyprenyltransferase
MMSFFNLLRWKNLVIVALTMILMRYAVIAPIISKITVVLSDGSGTAVPLSLKFPWYDFVILILATILITAGGYVINDYFDIKTDLINRGEVIVGTKIPRRHAMMLHNVLNIAGVAAGFYISWKAGYFWLGTLFLVVSGLLYFYSASYKRQFLIGNIVVSILTAMVPMLVVLYEWPFLYRYYAVNAIEAPHLGIIFYWVGGFAVFAFLTTLAREIIKDIEDFEGDRAYGRNTLPVVIGVLTSRIVAICLVIGTLVLLYIVWYFYLHDKITLSYISITIALPLLYIIFRLATGKTREHFHSASNMMKLVMFTGILYSVIVKIILTWNLL